MRHALRLASARLGSTWPNPAVGCVIVKDGAVIGAAATAPGGRPHAETQALAMAGEEARGATLYVTLEPCAHMGATPPCTDAIIAAGIARVVCAVHDVDPRTHGQGLTALRQAGVEVTESVENDEALHSHEGFFRRLRDGRPMVSLKLATTLDGAIAAPDGTSQWITNEAARRYTHLLRHNHDAVLTGIGTVLADNPKLTCRLPGLAHHPRARVVLDTQLRLPQEAALLEDIKTHPLWVLCSESAAQSAKAEALRQHGVEILPCPANAQGHLDLAAALLLLAARGLTRVLAECGAALATSLLAARHADWLHWFLAPTLAGDQGLKAVGALPANTLSELLRFTPTRSMMLGDNHYQLYHLAMSPQAKN